MVAGTGQEMAAALRTKVVPGLAADNAAAVGEPAEDVKHDGLRLRAFDFVSQEEVPLRLWLLTAAKTDKPKRVVLTAVDEAGWQEWSARTGAGLSESPATVRTADARQETVRQQPADAGKRRRGVRHRGAARHRPDALEGEGRSGQTDGPARQAAFCACWARRSMASASGTFAAVWPSCGTLPDLKGVPLWLQGKGDMAGMVLYAALFEPDVARLDLWHPPASHRRGPTSSTCVRILDMPQAVALAFPRPVRLYVKDAAEECDWAWPLARQQRWARNICASAK